VRMFYSAMNSWCRNWFLPDYLMFYIHTNVKYTYLKYQYLNQPTHNIYYLIRISCYDVTDKSYRNLLFWTIHLWKTHFFLKRLIIIDIHHYFNCLKWVIEFEVHRLSISIRVRSPAPPTCDSCGTNILI